MSQRYFLTTPPTGNRAFLEGDEARHVARVMRARTGDSLEVFDCQGRWWTATSTEIDRGKVELELGTGSSEPTAAGGRLTLAVALPKGDRQKWLIEKLTELGVDRLVPLQTGTWMSLRGASATKQSHNAGRLLRYARNDRGLGVSYPR